MQVDEYTIHDSHAHPIETMTLARHHRRVEQHRDGEGRRSWSGKTTLASYLNRFGFGRTTGLGFPGESEGIVPALSNWSDATLATISYGQGVSVTTAADGVGLRHGRERRRVGPAPVGGRDRGRRRNVHAGAPPRRRSASCNRRRRRSWRRCSPTSSRTAPGPARRSPAIRSRARPGTALKPSPTGGYYSDRYVASFIGFLPAGDPRIVVAAILDEPATVYGGVAAAPLFQQVARYAIQRLGIPTAPPVAPPPHVLGRHDLDRPANGGAGKLGGGDTRLPPVPLADLVATVPRSGDPRRRRRPRHRRRVRFPRGRARRPVLLRARAARRRARVRAAGARRPERAALVVERWLDVDAPQVLGAVGAPGDGADVGRGVRRSRRGDGDRRRDRARTARPPTTYILASIFRAAGRTPGVVGTTGAQHRRPPVPLARTTPEAPDLHRLLARMRDEGVRAVAMEVSSHALDQHRVDGIVFDVAVFTNLSQDHLDFHARHGGVLRGQGAALHPRARPSRRW